MKIERLSRIDFATGSGLPRAAWDEWDQPIGGRRWAKGRTSRLVLPRTAGVENQLLLLTADPYLVPPILNHQTLRIRVNGRTMRFERLQRRTVIACRVDPSVLDGHDEMVLEFEHPDVVQPNMVSDSTDTRGYSVAFVELLVTRFVPPPSRRTAPVAGIAPAFLPHVDELSTAELMKQFLSIGDNCEFGMAQRHAGAEPMDLLRFMAARMDGLLHGLETAFEGIADLHGLRYEVFGEDGTPEYVLKHRKFNIDAHTTVLEGSIDVDGLLSKEVKRLTVLQRLFHADLTGGQRIFVFKRNDPMKMAEVQPIFTRLRKWGPNVLLWVGLADAAHPPGTVEEVEPGLLRGYVDRFSPYDKAGGQPTPAWMDVCRKAYSLFRETRVTA